MLKEYRAKRDFTKTREPKGATEEKRTLKRAPPPLGVKQRRYVIQKHAASRLHYDLRLELNGVLLSWAVPKEPVPDTKLRRLAVHVEDHPLEYGDFAGTIPKGEYGAGTVEIWDKGTWEPVGDPDEGLKKGKLVFILHGKRLKGRWGLIRMKPREGEEDKDNWLLIKERDDRPPSNGSTNDQRARSKTKPRRAEALRHLSVEDVPGAVKARMPSTLSPELCLLVKQPPVGKEWIYEVKWDGYRVVSFVKEGKATLESRYGNDITKTFPALARELEDMKLPDCILDGEAVILDEKGISNMGLLRDALSGKDTGDTVYFAFELVYFDGWYLRGQPLVERKKLLRQLLEGRSDKIRYADHLDGDGPTVFEHACKMGLEGIVAKRIDSVYKSTRTSDWQKVKCLRVARLFACGFTLLKDSTRAIGALSLGRARSIGGLEYAGRVGTGFSNEYRKELYKLLNPLEIEEPPFVEPPGRLEAKGVHWVKPANTVEVHFMEVTADGVLRHPSFVPGSLRKEQAEMPTSAKTHPKITHPERIVDPKTKATKGDLARYYEAVAPWLIPHLKGRPLPLLRCPDGLDGGCFFHKHRMQHLSKEVGTVKIKESGGTKEYMVIENLDGLISLVQMSAIEYHPWGSKADDLEHPDRIIFDLDPGPGVEWPEVVDCALLLRDTFESIGVKTFAKLSGGKGLHLVAPIKPELDWKTVGTFCRALAEELAKQHPDTFVANMSKAKRKGKIFVDYLRNARGATAVSAYSLRARPGLPVAAPVSWEELPKTEGSAQVDYTTAIDYLKEHGDPWEGFFKVKQSLVKVLKKKA